MAGPRPEGVGEPAGGEISDLAGVPGGAAAGVRGGPAAGLAAGAGRLLRFRADTQVGPRPPSPQPSPTRGEGGKRADTQVRPYRAGTGACRYGRGSEAENRGWIMNHVTITEVREALPFYRDERQLVLAALLLNQNARRAAGATALGLRTLAQIIEQRAKGSPASPQPTFSQEGRGKQEGARPCAPTATLDEGRGGTEGGHAGPPLRPPLSPRQRGEGGCGGPPRRGEKYGLGRKMKTSL